MTLGVCWGFPLPVGQITCALPAQAEGLHFGVVPYVCRPALGIVSGMVGAGGNAGAVLTLWTIFKNPAVERTDRGYTILGAPEP